MKNNEEHQYGIADCLLTVAALVGFLVFYCCATALE